MKLCFWFDRYCTKIPFHIGLKAVNDVAFIATEYQAFENNNNIILFVPDMSYFHTTFPFIRGSLALRVYFHKNTVKYWKCCSKATFPIFYGIFMEVHQRRRVRRNRVRDSDNQCALLSRTVM